MLTPKTWDERREIVVPGDAKATLDFCVEHFVAVCKESIQDHGAFYVAFSGGSTPKALFECLSEAPFREQIEWKKVHVFWGDERSTLPENPESNYHMAMQACLKKVPIPHSQVHRMVAETALEANALAYEETIKQVLKERPFDLTMLGMGEDGHTASLFPNTEALKVQDRLVVANWVPQKNTWRMTLTYPCINASRHIAIYVLGDSKKEMLAKVLTSPEQAHVYPVQGIGTRDHKALWICDLAAAAALP